MLLIMNNYNDLSPEDDIEKTRNSKTDQLELCGLDEDNDNPAKPAQSKKYLPPDHQLKDSNLYSTEVYDEGEDDAATSLENTK